VSLKTLIASRVMQSLTGEARLRKNRLAFERRRGHGPHVVSYYHQVDDPYSHLAVQALAAFSARYDVVVVPHLVGPPADWAAPERDRLQSWARQDAALLAARHGLTFPGNAEQPDSAAVTLANASLIPWLGTDHFFEYAFAVGQQLWMGQDIEPVDESGVDTAIAAGEARRQADGHFMSAMIHYGGEWYWGVDRLHYLEVRLRELGAGDRSETLVCPCPMEGERSPTGDVRGVAVDFFLSFRSPYTYLALDRARRLAAAFGATFNIRFVLPMVMRGLPVPRMKGLYFSRDAAREARRLAIPFGRIADPVGHPVDRGYSLIPLARSAGREFEYCQAFMHGVWAEGIDAGSDAGLRRIVERAGLEWTRAKPSIGGLEWKPEAEANRRTLMQLGHWGVPVIRIGEVAVWGQDRLWVIEAELQRLAATPMR
jgi:2-hydroxychromene-2-carboxylate isomerase